MAIEISYKELIANLSRKRANYDDYLKTDRLAFIKKQQSELRAFDEQQALNRQRVRDEIERERLDWTNKRRQSQNQRRPLAPLNTNANNSNIKTSTLGSSSIAIERIKEKKMSYNPVVKIERLATNSSSTQMATTSAAANKLQTNLNSNQGHVKVAKPIPSSQTVSHNSILNTLANYNFVYPNHLTPNSTSETTNINMSNAKTFIMNLINAFKSPENFKIPLKRKLDFIDLTNEQDNDYDNFTQSSKRTCTTPTFKQEIEYQGDDDQTVDPNFELNVSDLQPSELSESSDSIQEPSFDEHVNPSNCEEEQCHNNELCEQEAKQQSQSNCNTVGVNDNLDQVQVNPNPQNHEKLIDNSPILVTSTQQLINTLPDTQIFSLNGADQMFKFNLNDNENNDDFYGTKVQQFQLNNDDN